MKFRKENYQQFMTAILNNEEDVVQIYLNQGINVNYQDSIGNTPLILAAKTNNIALLEMLVSHGAKLELSNLMDETPLLEAIDLKAIQSTQYLISVGANVQTKDYRGKSLLYRLLNNPDNQCFKILLDNHIEINPEDEIKILNNSSLKEIYLAFKEKNELEQVLTPSSVKIKKQKI